MPGFINFMVLPVLIIIAYDYVKKVVNFSLIENAIVFIGAIVSLVVIVAFISRINLSDFLAFSRGNISELDKMKHFFPKGTFFYNNIFYVLGISLIISFAKVLIQPNKIFSMIIFSITFFGLIVLFNKTAFIALAVALAYLVYVSRKYIPKKVMISVFALVAISMVSMAEFIKFFKDSDKPVSKMIHLESLWARTSIFDSILKGFSEYPAALFLGYGPESLLRIPYTEDRIIALMKTSKNGVEGTLDSAIMSYFVEYGLFFLCLYLSIFLVAIIKGLKTSYFNVNNAAQGMAPIYGGACFVYTFLCNFTQVLAVGKIAWVVFFLLSCFLLINLKHSRSTKEERE